MNENIFRLLNIARSSGVDKLKEVLAEQAKLDVSARREVRSNADLATLIFGVPFDEDMACDYYFWDNTTLSMIAPLSDYVSHGASLLEIGPGPAATLSRHLAAKKLGLIQTCAEIDLKFANSCRRAIDKHRQDIQVVVTDMTDNITDTFDVVFMNPPYVPERNLGSLKIVEQTQEFQAGYGGSDGADIVRRFLAEVPKVLHRYGYAILGINNLYLSDKQMMKCISDSVFHLHKRYYPLDLVPPFSQAYILTLK